MKQVLLVQGQIQWNLVVVVKWHHNVSNLLFGVHLLVLVLVFIFHHRIGSFLSTYFNFTSYLITMIFLESWVVPMHVTLLFSLFQFPLLLMMRRLPMPTICRQSKLWGPTASACIVGLLWGDSSHKAVLTWKQMYMSKCQHCHSEKILPTACYSKTIFTNCLTNSPPSQVAWMILVSFSWGLLRWLIWTEVCALSHNPIPLVPLILWQFEEDFNFHFLEFQIKFNYPWKDKGLTLIDHLWWKKFP